MFHSRIENIQDDILEHPNNSLIVSHSKRSALVSLRDGSTFFIEGDFTGTPAENEAEARRILTAFRVPQTRRRMRENI